MSGAIHSHNYVFQPARASLEGTLNSDALSRRHKARAGNAAQVIIIDYTGSTGIASPSFAKQLSEGTKDAGTTGAATTS
eukprot:2022736-Amphidinium_carterae.1